MIEPMYVYREELMRALDVKPSAYMNSEVDRACRAGSRAAEGLLHRIFYPEVIARRFDYPRPGGEVPGRIWFDERSLIELTSIASEGSIPSSAALSYPRDSAPYSRIDLDLNTNYSFSGGPQDAVTLTGLWGYRNDESTLGTLTANALATGALSVDAPAMVGMILRVGTERVQVTGQTWVSSGMLTSLAADKGATSVAVSSGSTFRTGETIVIDTERLEVVDIIGNTLSVRRAVGGSVLAAHTNATIYRQTSLTVERGSLGTTAGTHTNGDTVYLFEPPSLVKELSTAYAEDAFLQRNSGYARTVGSGESERQVSGRSISAIEQRAYARYGRKGRMRAV